MSATTERFFRATLELAGSGSIKQRLVGAYSDYLIDIDPEQLPEKTKDQFKELCGALTRVRPVNGEGPVFASVRKMSKQEADRAAEAIVSLYGELAATQEISK